MARTTSPGNKTQASDVDSFDDVDTRSQPSLLLWRAAAFITGSWSALFGTNVVYATIDMVETWLDNYYRLLQAKLGQDMYRTVIVGAPEMVRQEEGSLAVTHFSEKSDH